MKYTPIKLKVDENNPDYNLRAHNWIIARAEIGVKANPLPVFSTTASYKFDHEPKAIYRFVQQYIFNHAWGDIPMFEFVRESDGATLTMTIYSPAPETGL